MDDNNDKILCCCRMFFIQHGVYLIVLHSLVQGTYGVSLVITSSYKSINHVANYLTIASNLCLIPLGIFLFWANIYESWKGAFIACIVLAIVQAFNVIVSLYYFVYYVDFKANSILDKNLFWETETSWVSSTEVPFTLWHAFTVLLILIHCLWFYYSFISYKLSVFLRKKQLQ